MNQSEPRSAASGAASVSIASKTETQSRIQMNPSPVRTVSLGQDRGLTWIERVISWLSNRQIRAAVKTFAGLSVADIGCGYNAEFARSVIGQAKSITITDLSIAPELKSAPSVRVIEGRLPGSLVSIDDASVDVVICNSVIEHLDQPLETLSELYRICAFGGVVLINVPSWFGKTVLELMAYRLKIGPINEVEDHKMYFDPRDLWPLLIRSGFRPGEIRAFRHKFLCCTFAICRKRAA